MSTASQTRLAQPVQTQVTNPYVGIFAVFMGAGLATLNSRLLSVGLPDLRGALGFSFDAASWIPTALNMATMFSGVFVVFLNAFWGPRRILLPAAAIFMVASILLPFAPNYSVMLALVVVSGLVSGTFYSLTMTFVLTTLPKRLIILGIAAYAADIVFVSNIASLIEGWYIEHLSWHWIFWNAALFAPLMMLCVYFGIPRRPMVDPRPSWRGFTYFSLGLALLYGALDQGERLYWWHSGVIVAMLVAGLFLLGAAWVRRIVQPNPILKLDFLNTRNIIILALSIFVFKFVHLATIVLVPGFLGNIQNYRPLETGHTLAWVALPMFAVVWLVAVSIIYTNSRLILAVGLTLGAVSCWICAHLDTSWAGNSFELVELLLATGLACSYVGLVSSIVLEGLEAGALTSAANAATFSGFMHFIRIFGGQVGVAIMTRLISVREQFHSNLLGLNVQAGSWLTVDRVRVLSAGLLPGSIGPEEAQSRAIDILSKQVRAQAYSLASADGFILIGWVVVAYLLMMLLLRPGSISYRDLSNMHQITGIKGTATRGVSMKKGSYFSRKFVMTGVFILVLMPLAGGQERKITLQEAMDLALRQNRTVQIAHYGVAAELEKQRGARSNYFPTLTNESNALYVTDLQRVEVPPGTFGKTPSIPSSTVFLTQGRNAFQSSGTMLAQPLTQLIKIHEANKIAAADVGISEASLQKASTDVVYSVHQLYYRLLVMQLQRKSAELQIASSNDNLTESGEQYKNGSLLQVGLVESRANALEAKQALLTADMQISDLTVQLDDVLGLPLDTKLILDPEVNTVFDQPAREESLRIALKENPTVQQAVQRLSSARAAEAAAKAEYIPDITAYGRYSYQNGVPFLDKNFGTFGIHLTYDLFDAGKRSALVRERRAEVSEAAEDLERTKEEVGVRIATIYNKLETTRAMVEVAREDLAARQENARLSEEQFKRGVLLTSQRDASHAQAMKAQAGFLEASLDYLLTRDELTRTLGRTAP